MSRLADVPAVLAGALTVVGAVVAVRRLARPLLADPTTRLSRLIDEKILPHGVTR